MRRDFDVIVVGAGPGGATASRACAQEGLETLLIEKERFPRYKACGGCLSMKTVHLLGFDLTPVVENTVSATKFTYCLKDSFVIHSAEPTGCMVMRDRLDHFLVGKAIEAGVEFLEGERVIRVEEKEGNVEVELERGERVSSTWSISISVGFRMGTDGSSQRGSISPSV
jgi:flavin-dependent dehydrogenase